MATTVYLTRHGQTEWNSRGRMMGWADEDVNALGRAQAMRLARRMENLRLEAVYTSPLKRALTTGAIIGQSHELSPQPVRGLIEINYGDWEGLPADVVADRWPELRTAWQEDPARVRPPHGENGLLLARRARSFLGELTGVTRDASPRVSGHRVAERGTRGPRHALPSDACPSRSPVTT